MEHNKHWDRVFSTASWIIVLALLYGAIAIWITPPSGVGPFAQLLGVQGAQIFYCVLYGAEALVLGYSKAFKKKRLRKQALMVIYLTGFFTTLLIWLMAGLSVGLLDNLVLALLASGCWLYWTFKTEYLTPGQFLAATEHMRDDLPPTSP